MNKALKYLIFIMAGGGLSLFFLAGNKISVSRLAMMDIVASGVKETSNPVNLIDDLPPQKPLENPPAVIKAIYATGWSAGSVRKMDYLIDLIKKTELNAIVIDIKDYTGKIGYDTNIPEVNKYGAEEIRIRKPNALIKRLHEEGIYVIARQTIFQDPILAGARPSLALVSSSTGKQWQDNKGLMWIDPTAREAWDYNITIAKDALTRGFDEINFDYIRFASDGNMSDIKYPFWNNKTLKRVAIRDFMIYLRKSLPEAKISADLFGLVTINPDDIGVGQNIDDAYNYFDAIAPMVYPSHYHKGFNGYQNPAQYPYEVVYASLSEANKRLNQYIAKAEFSTSTEKYLVKKPQLRPWLQDFDLGATYDASKVMAQIQATYAAATGTPMGWMLWDPSNNYTREALLSD